MDIKAIRTDQDHDAAIAEIERLWGSEAGSEAADRMEVLTILADAYERQRWPMDPLDPIDALKGHMDMNGYSQSDLAALLSSPSRASEILNRQRRLTLEHIRRIERGWKLPAVYLIGDYDLQVRKVPRGPGLRRTAAALKAAS